MILKNDSNVLIKVIIKKKILDIEKVKHEITFYFREMYIADFNIDKKERKEKDKKKLKQKKTKINK